MVAKSGKGRRDKGGRGEREAAKVLQSIFPHARRGVSQTRSGGDGPDVEGTPFWVEVKRQKRCRIKAALEQALSKRDQRPPLAITKDDREPWIITMYAKDWIAIMKLYRDYSMDSTNLDTQKVIVY